MTTDPASSSPVPSDPVLSDAVPSDPVPSEPVPRVRDAPLELRRALLGCAALFANNGFASFAYLARLPELQDRVGLDIVGIGAVLLLGSLGGVLTAPLVAPYLRRFGTATGSVLGSALMATTLAGIALSTRPWQLALALAATGAADVFSDLPMNAQGSVIQDRLPRSVFNRLHGLWSVGALGGAGAAAAAAALGVGVVPFLLGLSVLLAVVAVAVRPLLFDEAASSAPATAHDGAGTAAAPHDVVEDEVEPDGPDTSEVGISPLRAGLLLGMLGFLAAYMEAPPAWGGLLVTRDLGGTASAGALVVAAFSAAQVVGRLSGDAVVDRIGPVRAVQGSAVAQLLGLGVAILATGTVTALVSYALLGLGAAVVFPMLYRAAATTPGLSSGAGLAAMNVGARSGFVVGPLLIGAAADRAGVGNGLALVVGCTTIGLLVLSSRFRTAAR